MNENPFRNPVIGDFESSPGQRDFSIVGLLMQFARFLLAAAIFLVQPIFITPVFADMYEEFAIELPVMTQLAIQFSNIAIKYFVIYVPITGAVLIGIEAGLFLMRDTVTRRMLSALWWMVLMLLLVTTVITFWIPYQALVSGLTN